MNKIILALIVVLLFGVGVYFLYQSIPDTIVVTNEADPKTIGTTTQPKVETPNENATATVAVDPKKTMIGTSVEGRDIMAYHYGTGTKEILFVGGIHGGYEWNTVLVAYELMDYLEKTPTAVPADVRVTVIPVLNPDGLNKVVGTDGRFTKSDVPAEVAATVPGRFNAHNVDLNRNFDCDWQTTGRWQNTNVSGGSKIFSEPESQAIQKYEDEHDLTAVVVWYSAAGGVFASNCHTEVSAETRALTNVYAKASGYVANESFDFYAITGDMVNWFAKKGVPAISVLLTTHDDVEWSKNKLGIDAVLKSYAE